MEQMINETIAMREGDQLDAEALTGFLASCLPGFSTLSAIRQFPGGYSNLTYLLQTNLGEYVLRKPPRGAAIKSAHDMGREYEVLRRLEGVFSAPKAIAYSEDPQYVGAPFYLMERVSGIILRNQPPAHWPLDPQRMRAISEAAIDTLAQLHLLSLETTGLLSLGKPEGYVARQIKGWTERYVRAQTDDIPAMESLMGWLAAHQPADGPPAFIHNDYKYDNLVLDPDQPGRIRAVLDWEMATVGDARMDLGMALAYWGEAAEARAQPLVAANLTWLPGNLNRQELAARYAATTAADLSGLLFYYVFGTFKIAVIVQQIYARWKQGHSHDPRFGGLLTAVQHFAHQGQQALDKDRISWS